MPNNIGSPIPSYTIYVRRASNFGFVINWWQDDEYTVPENDINGKDFQVIVGDRVNPEKVWQATAVGNSTTFALSVDDSDLPFDLYDGLILMSPGPAELALADARIVVQPS